MTADVSRADFRPALARCVGTDTAAFSREHWGASPKFTPHGADSTGFADLLDLDGVDELLSRRGLRTPFLRIARNGTVVDASTFTAGGGAGAEVRDQVSDDAVLALFLDGASLVLQGLHRLWPPIIDFVSRLSAELGHPAQANAYVTPPESRGFDAHYDVHDVFVLQLAGKKEWRIHEPVLANPLRDQPWTDRRDEVASRAAEEPWLDTVLAPGDALYLPRGWLHAARAQGDVSAHLTIGVHPVTRWSLVQAMTAAAADDPELRASLPLGIDVADPIQLDAERAATVDALVDRLRRGESDAEAVATRLRRDVWPQSRPAPVSPLRQADALRTLSAHSVFRLRRGLHTRLETDGARCRLLLRGRWLGFDAGAEPALRLVLRGEDTTVEQLELLVGDQAHPLVVRLLREAVLVPSA